MEVKDFIKTVRTEQERIEVDIAKLQLYIESKNQERHEYIMSYYKIMTEQNHEELKVIKELLQTLIKALPINKTN